MIDYIDRVPSQGMAGKRKITYSDDSEEVVTMSYADEPIDEGTPLNRANLMAIQGFQGKTISLNNGTIVETDSQGNTLSIIRNQDGTITERFVGVSGKIITKTISMNNNIISEVIT